MVGRLGLGPLVIGVMLFAGCSGAAEDAEEVAQPTVAPTPEATEEFGSVAGRVADDEGMPIVGATVALLETDLQTTTDESGDYTFNDVAPGEYSLAAERLGYESVAMLVLVFAGEIATADLILLALEIDAEPIWITSIHDGFLACSWNPYYGLNMCGGLAGEDTSRFPFTIDATMEWKSLVAEVVWEPATAVTAQQLEIDICDFQSGPEAQAICLNAAEYWSFTHGPSPLVVMTDELPIDATLEYEVDVTAPWVVDDPTSFAFQQPFTLYLTLCYIEECPEDFAARPPA